MEATLKKPSRKREPTNLVILPEIKEPALRLAQGTGQSLSRYIERMLEDRLIRKGILKSRFTTPPQKSGG